MKIFVSFMIKSLPFSHLYGVIKVILHSKVACLPFCYLWIKKKIFTPNESKLQRMKRISLQYNKVFIYLGYIISLFLTFLNCERILNKTRTKDVYKNVSKGCNEVRRSLSKKITKLPDNIKETFQVII